MYTREALNHSILTNEMKVMRSFKLHVGIHTLTPKVPRHFQGFFASKKSENCHF